MKYEFPEACPILKKDYTHKIRLFGAFVLDSFGAEGTGRYIDLYLKSHGKYFIIKTDVLRRYGTPDSLKIRAISYDEFGYSRLCTNVIKTEDNGVVSFPELRYFSFKNSPEIIFDIVEFEDDRKIILSSNIANFSLIAGTAHSTIDLTKASICTRDELIDLNFSGKEKEDIMEILRDNDKFQKECYLKELGLKEAKAK